MLATAILKGPYSVYGFIKFDSYSLEVDHLNNLNLVELKKKDKSVQLTIETIKKVGNHNLIKFLEISTPEEARKYNGWEIWLSRDKAAPLEKGEFYITDLLNLNLTYQNNTVAKIVSFVDGPQAVLLEVETVEDGKKYLIPFMDNYIGQVDLKNKTVELLMEDLIK